MNSNESGKTWRPVEASERYTTLDLLRGFALFGVLLINLLYFFRVSLFDHILHFHSHAGMLNHAVDLLARVLVEFKAFDLFALTFGIGVAVQRERAGLRGMRIEAFLARRFLVLLAFGACHMLLVSNVDILTLYSVCGLLLIPLLRLPAAVLAMAGLAAIYLPSVFSGFRGLPSEAVLQAHVANATRIYGQGSFGAILEFRWHETQELIAPLLVGVAQKTFGMVLLGVAVWRAGVIREPQRYRSLLWAIALGAGIVGIVNTTADVLWEVSRKAVPVMPAFAVLGSHVPLAFAYASGLLLWRRSARAETLMAPVAAAGRMALTNYLMQSLVLAFVFYGYGLRRFGRLDPTTAVLIGVPFYAGQLWFSRWWLNQYRFGPFEWVWRSLTYGRRQPMRLLQSNPSNGVSIPRWVALILAPLLWSVAIPLAHGVIPWAIASLTHRFGWTAGRPGIWNLPGLVPVALGAAVLIWVLVVGLGQTPKRVKLGLTPSVLMMCGPYAFTRNPMYVAEMGIWLGWALFFGSVGVLAGAVALCAVVSLTIVPREEHTLEAILGQSYVQYKNRAPRWF